MEKRKTMEDIVYHIDIKGWIHFIAAIISLITGTWIVLTTKATKLHKQVGYVYVVAMVIVIVTSFMIYRLFDGFGIFHGFAILSTILWSVECCRCSKKERNQKRIWSNMLQLWAGP